MTCMMTSRQFNRDKRLKKNVSLEEQKFCNIVNVPRDGRWDKINLQNVDDLSISEKLGGGSFAVVVLVESGAKQFALKMLNRQDLRREEREADIGKFLIERKHAFIVKSLASFPLPGNVTWRTSGGYILRGPYDVAILLEYIEGGTLYKSIELDRQELEKKKKPISPDMFRKYRRWAAEILEAMSFLHSMHVVHRDLKPDDVLLKPMPNRAGTFACLADFTFTTLADWATWESIVGQSVFAAPEVRLGGGGGVGSGRSVFEWLGSWLGWRKHTPHIDVYSYGKTLKSMIWCTDSPVIIGCDVLPAKPKIESARNLVLQTTHVSPKARGLFPDIKRHPFFKDSVIDDEMKFPAINFERLVADATCS